MGSGPTALGFLVLVSVKDVDEVAVWLSSGNPKKLNLITTNIASALSAIPVALRIIARFDRATSSFVTGASLAELRRGFELLFLVLDGKGEDAVVVLSERLV